MNTQTGRRDIAVFVSGQTVSLFGVVPQGILLGGATVGLVALTQTLAMPQEMVIFGPLSDVVKMEQLLVVSGVLMSLFVVAVAFLPTGREVWRERA